MRRLAPLYAISFFQGLILWYAIEKVFMTHIGFNAFLITFSIVVMNIAMLVTEIPAGILADRWSRKKVLIVSLTLLGLATLILGTSHSVLPYLIGVILYGLHMATYSGLTDSITYDSLLEIQGSRVGYEKYFGYTRALGSIALILGSLLGGLVAKVYGLHYAYLLSVPSSIFALLSATLLVEPPQHQKSEATLLLHHVKETFLHVWRKGLVGWIVTSIVSISIITGFLLEVDQLWPIALALPLILYGPLNALLLLGYGLGTPLANKITKNKMISVLACVLGLLCILALSIRNMPLIALSQFGIIGIFSALYIIANGKLHDTLPSRIRVGALSVVSTLTTISFLPLLLIFGRLAQSTSVFTASYMLIPIAILALVSYIRITS